MAAFAAEGKRIPRRGEVGLKAEEIEKFEGYLFSLSLSLPHPFLSLSLSLSRYVYM